MALVNFEVVFYNLQVNRPPREAFADLHALALTGADAIVLVEAVGL